MKTLVALGLLVAAPIGGTASAQNAPPSSATMIEDFKCASGTCATTCVGPGGTITINASDVKAFLFTAQPQRLWLLADASVYVLGEADHCEFGGATTAPIGFIVPPPQVSSLGPAIPPAHICIGGRCTP
jgi:hypothetical protein